MTASNHALTGAVIALSLKQPLLALPLALVSHFALDALPHFGTNGDIMGRNRLLLFRIVWPLDALVLVSLFLFVALNVGTTGMALVAVTAMFLATSPDLAWIYRFALKEQWGKIAPAPMDAFNRFHAKIQWGERPWGILVELIWFSFMFTALVKLLI